MERREKPFTSGLPSRRLLGKGNRLSKERIKRDFCNRNQTRISAPEGAWARPSLHMPLFESGGRDGGAVLGHVSSAGSREPEPNLGLSTSFFEAKFCLYFTAFEIRSCKTA